MPLRSLTAPEQERLIARWKMAEELEASQRENELADLTFEAGEHWDAKVKSDRERSGKPCLTIDLLAGPIKQVTNQARSARPGIVVTPRGNSATTETAQTWQAILRRMETNSNADYAYTWANQHQVKMGRGYWRLLPFYVSDKNDEQDVAVKWIDNQHSVYLGPATEADGADRRWAFITERMLHGDYEERFGKSAAVSSIKEFGSLGDGPPEWLTKQHVWIVECFYLEQSTRTRHALSDGTYVFEDMLERGPAKRAKDGKYGKGDPKLAEGVAITRTREVNTTTVKWQLLNGALEVLEETTLPGRYIPIVKIIGERRNIGGKVDERGMVRMAKGPAIMTDYLESAVAQIIGTGTLSRWLIEASQREGFEDMWATANTKNWDALVWVASALAPSPPIPIDREPPIQATVEAAQRAAMQQRAILGYVDVQADEQGPQGSAVSGRAINARKLQQEMQSSDYMDGLGRGIRLTAKIAHEMYREILDVPRILRIKGADEKEYGLITHHGPDQASQAAQMKTEQIKHVLDVTAGDYDFAFSPGKSYQSQRQDANDAMGQLFTAAPELAQVGADIWVKNMDWPGAQELAERLKKNNPMAQDDQQQAPIPPQVQQRLQQLDQYAQMAHEQIQQLNEIINAKQLELASKEKIAADDNLTKIQLAEMQLGVQANIAQMQNHIQKLETMIGVIHETRMQEHENAHEVALAATQHQQVIAQQQHAAEQGLITGEVDHQRGLEAGAQGHQQALEQGDQGHAHAIAQIKAKPKPAAKGPKQ